MAVRVEHGSPVGESGAQHSRARGRSGLRVQDPEVAGELVSRAYLPVRMSPAAGGRFDLEMAEVRMGRMTAGVISLGNRSRITSAPAENVHLNITINGRAAWQKERGDSITTMGGSGAVYNPGEVADTVWSEASDHLCLMVPREALEAEIEALTGRAARSPLLLAPKLALDEPPCRLLASSCDILVAELHNPRTTSGFTSIGRHLEGLVLDGLLLGHEHNYSELLRRGPSAGRTPITRAAELMEERPEHPWTTVGLAQEVHLSVRALQEGFRRQYDLSPMTYLRTVRMRRVNRLLESALPGSVRVQDVAVRHGFLHLGRFSAAYRGIFGEPPSATLARFPG